MIETPGLRRSAVWTEGWLQTAWLPGSLASGFRTVRNTEPLRMAVLAFAGEACWLL